jgi:hypothetical protein
MVGGVIGRCTAARQVQHGHTAEQHRDASDDVLQHRAFDEEFGQYSRRPTRGRFLPKPGDKSPGYVHAR